MAKVLRRADGKVSLAPELMIKGRLERKSFELSETWNKEARFWTPLTMLERKRYLLILNLDDEGRPIFSKDPIAESVAEVTVRFRVHDQPG